MSAQWRLVLLLRQPLRASLLTDGEWEADWESGAEVFHTASGRVRESHGRPPSRGGGIVCLDLRRPTSGFQETTGNGRRPDRRLAVSLRSTERTSGTVCVRVSSERPQEWHGPNRDASPVSLEGSRGCAPPVGGRLGHLTNSS